MNMDENLLKSFSPLDASEAFKEYYRRQRDMSVPPSTTPLHVAALNGDVARVQQLLETRRVAGSALDASGNTALHHAALLGHERIVSVLIEAGVGVNSVTSDGNTPLHKAAQGGYAGVGKLLLDYGARLDVVNAVLIRTARDCRAVHTKLGEYPVDVCAKRKHTEMTVFLRGYVGADGPA